MTCSGNGWVEVVAGIQDGMAQVMTADSPDLVAAKRLLDAAKQGGFRFTRVPPGADRPLWGVRETLGWRDTLYLAGFGRGCTATRARKFPLIVPGGPLVTQRIDGDAISVLRTVEVSGIPEPRLPPVEHSSASAPGGRSVPAKPHLVSQEWLKRSGR